MTINDVNNNDNDNGNENNDDDCNENNENNGNDNNEIPVYQEGRLGPLGRRLPLPLINFTIINIIY